MIRFVIYLLFVSEISLAMEHTKTDLQLFDKEVDMFIDIISQIKIEIAQKQNITHRKKKDKVKLNELKKFEDIYMNFENLDGLLADLSNQFNFLKNLKFYNFKEFKAKELRKFFNYLDQKFLINNKYRHAKPEYINHNNLIHLKCIRALTALRFLIKAEERYRILKQGIFFDKKDYYRIFESNLYKNSNLKNRFSVVLTNKKNVKYKNERTLENDIFSSIIAEIIFKTAERVEHIKKSIEFLLNWYYLDSDIRKNIKHINANILIGKIEKNYDIKENELIYNFICNADFFINFLSSLFNEPGTNLKEEIEKNIFDSFGCMLLCGDGKKQYTQILDILFRYDNLVNNLYLDYNVLELQSNTINNKKEIKMGNLDECFDAFNAFKKYFSNKNFTKRRAYGEFNYCLNQSSPRPSDVIISIFGEFNMLFILFKELKTKFLNIEARKEKNYKLKLSAIENILLFLGNCYFEQIDTKKNINIDSDLFLNKYTNEILEELHLKGNLVDKLKISFKNIYINEVEKEEILLSDERKIKKLLTILSIINNSEYLTLHNISKMSFFQLLKYIALIYDIKTDNLDDLLEKIKNNKDASEQIKMFYHYIWKLITTDEHYIAIDHKIEYCYACEIFFNMLNFFFSNKLEEFRNINNIGKNTIEIYNLMNLAENNLNFNISEMMDFKNLLKSKKKEKSIQNINIFLMLKKFKYAVFYEESETKKMKKSFYKKHLFKEVFYQLGDKNDDAQQTLKTVKPIKSIVDNFADDILEQKITQKNIKNLINKSVDILDKKSMNIIKKKICSFDEHVEFDTKEKKVLNTLIIMIISKMKNNHNFIALGACKTRTNLDFLQNTKKYLKHVLSKNIKSDFNKDILDYSNTNLNTNLKNIILNYEEKVKYCSIELTIFNIINIVYSFIATKNDEYNLLFDRDKIILNSPCFAISLILIMSNIMILDTNNSTFIKINSREEMTTIMAIILNNINNNI